VIEGLRVLPHYQEARNKGGVVGHQGCEECKQTVSVQTRQELGCGYEPALDGARPWAPESWRERGLSLAVCPGYTTALPIVQEIVEVHAQWKAGYLTESLDGEPPTDVTLKCLTYLEAGINEFQADSMRAASKGPQ
jgi:hypothetical protein